MSRSFKPIPVSAAETIAKRYGYHQVIVIGRVVDQPGKHAHAGAGGGGEHVTTYGVDKAHCNVAAAAGDFLKHKVMGWAREPGKGSLPTESTVAAIIADICDLDDHTSPQDQPDLLLGTTGQIEAILRRHLLGE